MRKLVAGLIALSLALVPAVAVATHINEPTAPITGLNLRFTKYPDPTPLFVCEPNEANAPTTTLNGLLRVEGFIQAMAAPSEHFRVEWTSTYQAFPGGPVNIEAYDIWAHQNMPPHPAMGPIGWIFMQPTLRIDKVGLWKFIVTVTGQESGAEFTRTCTFRKVAP